MNKSLWCTCFKQFVNDRLFIHNMLHNIVILRVEPCWLFRSNKAMNKPLWCTSSRQFLNNRLFIHNMLHHIVRLRVEPCWVFFLLSPSFHIFIFEKKTALQDEAIKTLRLKIWPQILRISTYRVSGKKNSSTLVTRTLVYSSQTFIFSNYFSCSLEPSLIGTFL